MGVTLANPNSYTKSIGRRVLDPMSRWMIKMLDLYPRGNMCYILKG
jgi:hypothetical protein